MTRTDCPYCFRALPDVHSLNRHIGQTPACTNAHRGHFAKLRKERTGPRCATVLTAEGDMRDEGNARFDDHLDPINDFDNNPPGEDFQNHI